MDEQYWLRHLTIPSGTRIDSETKKRWVCIWPQVRRLTAGVDPASASELSYKKMGVYQFVGMMRPL